MPSKTIIAAAIAGGISLSVQAQQSIDAVIVTATRSAQTVDATLASVTVITREEIDRMQSAQLSDLLQHRAGIHLASNGPFGKHTSLFMRGSNSSHVVLLIDGVRSGSATSGGAAWEGIPLSEIERIEIVRGPRASIYGADAIGGVIQIFTRQGEAGKTRLRAHSRVGSFNTGELGVGASGGNSQTRWSLSANHQQTDGINVRDTVGDDERDGNRHSALSWKLSHQLDSGVEFFSNALFSEGKSDFDVDQWGVGPYASAHTDVRHGAIKAGARASLHALWYSELSIAHNRDEGTTYYEETFNNRINSYREQLDWRNDLSLGQRTLWTIGLDLQRERVDSSTAYSETRRDNHAVYQLLQGELERHSLLASLRYDDNEAYGNYTTGQLAWGFALSPTLRSRLSWGTAFKAPSFNDLFWPGSGNPALKPEESESWEAGLRYSQGSLYWDAAIHYSEVDNLIAWAPGDGGMWQPANIANARIRGAELETGVHHGPWKIALAASLVDAIDRDNGTELPRRPRETLRLDLDRQLKAFSLGGSVIAQGRSYDNAANSTQMSGHGLLNLRAAWQATPEWTVRANVDNSLDKDYQTTANYNQPGRAFYLSAHYRR